MITYNHEKYIEQAVRSVMIQETDFDYELVIGEDCSTDRTREIVLRLKEEFPEKIRLILHEQNVGMAQNLVEVYRHCEGEYIALLEGDDYWIDHVKLRLQVDYLNKHEQCVLCSHTALVIDDKGHILRSEGWDLPPFNLKDYFRILLNRSNYIITSSVIFRRPDADIPVVFADLRAAVDWALYAWILSFGGEAHNLCSEPMSAYRLHAGGITHITRIESNDAQVQRKRALHYKYVAEDAILVSRLLPKYAQDLLLNWSRLFYERAVRLAFLSDRQLFDQLHDTLRKLSPSGRYIPSSPRHLAVVSRFIGYQNAEWLAKQYRAIVRWRART